MFAVVSRRKAALSLAAWLLLRGGQRRLLERPARGAFAITPIAHVARIRARSRRSRSPLSICVRIFIINCSEVLCCGYTWPSDLCTGEDQPANDTTLTQVNSLPDPPRF